MKLYLTMKKVKFGENLKESKASTLLLSLRYVLNVSNPEIDKNIVVQQKLC